MLPQCVLVTDGKTHDRRAIQDLHFEPGDLLIFDRAYQAGEFQEAPAYLAFELEPDQEQVSDQGGPDLDQHGILGSAVKGLNFLRKGERKRDRGWSLN
jgi:hypothetical protein